MDRAGSESELLGRVVRVLAWADLWPSLRSTAPAGTLPAEPVGTVVEVGDFGWVEPEVKVRIAGLSRTLIFGFRELELLPPAGEADRVRRL